MKITVDKEHLRYLLHDQRMTFKSISKELGIRVDILVKICKEYNLYLHPKNFKNEKRTKYLEELMPKDFLLHEYCEKNRTALDISEELSIKEGYPIFASSVIKMCEKYSIPTKNYSESATLAESKRSKTVLSEYGVSHISKSEAIKEKKIKSSLDKYGTTNVFQSDEVKMKSRETLSSKYGVSHISHLPNFTNRNVGRRSLPHKKIEEYLDSLGIHYESEVAGKFRSFNHELGRDYCPVPDIVIPDYFLILEINGDYWHANPLMYKPEDLFALWAGSKTAKEIWERDSIRKRHLESFGYSILEIWGSEIKNGSYKLKLQNDLQNKINQKNK